jgi:hypothetical protein
MQQRVAERATSLSEVMRKGVNVTLAAKVLNRCIQGDETVTAQMERVATVIYNKMVPSYAAIQVDIVADRPDNVFALNAMLLSAGLDALPTEDKPVIEHVPEKTDSV